MTGPLSAEVRAVIDVNLLVRGILSQTSSSARLIQLLKQGRFVVVTSRTHVEDANISMFLSQRNIQLVRLNEFLAVLQN